MNRLKLLIKILRLIFPIVFNVCFFIIGGFDHPVAVWISYAFIHIAYLCLVFTPKLVKPSRSSAILEYTLDLISTTYLAIQILIGLVFIISGSISVGENYLISGWKVPFLIQFLAFAVYAGLMLWNLIVKEHIEKNEARREVEFHYIKSASSELEAIMEMANDRNRRKMIENAYDAMRTGQVVSDVSVEPIEKSIMLNINELREVVNYNDEQIVEKVINSLLTKIADRDRKLKLKA